MDIPTKLFIALPMKLPTVLFMALSMTISTEPSMVLPTALPLPLPMALSIDLPTVLSIVSGLMVDANDKFYSTLTSHHPTDENNIDLLLPLSPYPNISFPFHWYCITGIEFTYHPLLYHNHSTWIKHILPILQLLISTLTVIKGCTKKRNKRS